MVRHGMHATWCATACMQHRAPRHARNMVRHRMHATWCTMACTQHGAPCHARAHRKIVVEANMEIPQGHKMYDLGIAPERGCYV